MDRITSVVQTATVLGGNSTGKNERIYSVGRESELFKSRCKEGVFPNRGVCSCAVEEDGGTEKVIARQ